MDKIEFHKNFQLAIEALFPFAQRFLTDSLPTELRYLIFLNQSYDGNKLVGDEELFSDDSLPENKVKEFENSDLVINHLWRDGKIPEWINLSIHSFDTFYTYISLICCGRFTKDENLLYHPYEKYQPFHILGPNLPQGFESLEKSGKFKLAWHGRSPDKNEPYW